MNKLAIVKGVSHVVVSVGVGAVLGNAIQATSPINASTLNTVLTAVGKFALGGILADASTKYVNTIIEDTAKAFKAGNTIVIDPSTTDEK
jgi:hypothetical protein